MALKSRMYQLPSVLLVAAVTSFSLTGKVSDEVSEDVDEERSTAALSLTWLLSTACLEAGSAATTGCLTTGSTGAGKVPGLPLTHLLTVCLYEDCVSPKNGQARNQWQNCRIGKPSAKKWVFLPDHVGLGPEVKEKLGEIRSLLETLGGTLWVQIFFYLY